jgi:hypothetical protein
MLLVLCFVAVGCLAANATTGYTVAFTGYCDGVSIANYTGIIFGDTHNVSACGYTNTYGGGFRHAAAGYTYYTGAAFDVGDAFYSYELGINATYQVLLQVTGTVKKPGLCGWVYYDGPDGVSNYYDNSGTCTIVSRPSSREEVQGLKPAAMAR